MAGKRKKKDIHFTRKVMLVACLLLGVGGYFIFQPKEAKPGMFIHRPPVEKELTERVARFVSSRPLSDKQVAIYIYDLTSDTVLYAKNPDQLMPPASCTKLVTAIAGLGRFGLDYSLNDSLFYQGTLHGSSLYGNLILKADADPLLWNFNSLVGHLKEQGIRTIHGEIRLELAQKEPMKLHSSWSKHDMHVSSLPILFQGQDAVQRSLQAALRKEGILLNRETPMVAQGTPRTFLAVESHTLREVFKPVLKISSNIVAQAIWTSLNGRYCRFIPDQNFPQDFLMDFIGKELRLPFYQYTLSDACGLSPENRLSPRFLTDILRWAWVREDLRDFLLNEALPVAGNLGAKSGSLHWRMENSAAVNKVFAKTGTLNRLQCTTLSGYLQTKNGHWLIFSIMHQGLPVDVSRPYQDKLCIELCR